MRPCGCGWLSATITVVLAVAVTMTVRTLSEWDISAVAGESAAPDAHASMTAVAYTKHGTSSVLVAGQYPRPVPLPHQVLVEVHHAALNPCDFKFRRMKLPRALHGIVDDMLVAPKPKIPGADLAGRVVAVGDAVPADGPRVGDRVAAMTPLIRTRWGTYAEYAAVDHRHAAVVPAGIDLADAASLPLVALTVLKGLHKVEGYPGSLQGKKVLVQAGAGGVGTFAIQWCAKVLGMEVATTASPASAALARDLGATTVIDYTTTAFELTGDTYDVIVDTMSYLYEARTLNGNTTLLRPGGCYLNILSSDWALDAVTGEEVANDGTTVKNLLRHTVGGYAKRLGLVEHAIQYHLVQVSPNGRLLAEVFDAVAAGSIRAVVDRSFPLAEAGKAHDYLAQGHASGKVLLDIRAVTATAAERAPA